MNPRANGMVERFNRTIKAGIRKLLGMSPDLRWWEVIPDVVRGMRVIAQRSTGASPYLLAFKQPPAVAVANEVWEAVSEEPWDVTEAEIES